MGCRGLANRRRALECGSKCQRKALAPEPPPAVPVPVEISAVIGVYFSGQSGNGLSCPSKEAYLLVDS